MELQLSLKEVITGGKLNLVQLQLTDRNGKNYGENKAAILPSCNGMLQGQMQIPYGNMVE
ncbi:MAG: hypothetical protein IPG87_12860 [Saprospiraceae bacterium]|nr:hypothetical protein [Candidatus Vicinibacter affinis]